MDATRVLTRETFDQGLQHFGGEARRWFAALAGECIQRLLRQQSRPPLATKVMEVLTGELWSVAESAGWPTPREDDRPRGPQERAIDAFEPELAGMAARAASADPETAEVLLTVLRQLLKTCLYGEFTTCRESYREVKSDGRCKRQMLASVRGRVSGTPCIDCPYTVTLERAQHRDLLRRHWVATHAVPFDDAASCFLPDDFRAFRQFLWMRARFAADSLPHAGAP